MYRFGLLIALALVAAGSLATEALYGRLAGYGKRQAIIDAQGERLVRLPEHFGEWSMQQQTEISDHALTMLECRHYVARTYVHQGTGETVSITMLVGPAGPLVVHRPEVCFPSRKYEMTQRRRRAEFAGSDPPPVFYATKFRSTVPGEGSIWAHYSWNTGSGWQAPDDPRVALGAEPVLAKMQLITAESPGSKKDTPEIASRFLADFLPVADAALFASVDAGADTAGTRPR